MASASLMSKAKAAAKKSGKPYAVIGSTVRQKKDFFERLPKGSITVYPSGKIFPPPAGTARKRRRKKNPELLIVENPPKSRREKLLDKIGGVKNADRMMQLLTTSYPSGTAYDRLYGRGKSATEVFKSKARREGFTASQINAFLAIDNAESENGRRIAEKRKGTGMAKRRKKRTNRRRCSNRRRKSTVRVRVRRSRATPRKRRRNFPLKKKYGGKLWTKKAFVKHYGTKRRMGTKARAGKKWTSIRSAMHGSTRLRTANPKRRRKVKRRKAAKRRLKFRRR